MAGSASPNESVLLFPERLVALLGAAARRFDLDAIAECDSTNSRLLAMAGNAPSGRVLAADRQTAGRGRRGRVWRASPEDSLTFSLLWRFAPGVSPAGLSLAVGLALTEGLAALGETDVRLKWPNDLLRPMPARSGQADFGKLGGILIELSSGRAGLEAVIGIGLNLRAPAAEGEALPPLGLAAAHDRHAVLAALLRALLPRLEQFGMHGFAPMREDWNAGHAFAGHAVHLLQDEQKIDGVCLDVTADGALRVQTSQGVLEWLAGDVSLRPAQ